MMASRICCIYTRGRELRYVREDISTKGKRHLPLELYRVPCGPRRGRDDRQPSQTASLESTAHNWPIAGSANGKERKNNSTLKAFNLFPTQAAIIRS